MPKPKEKNVKIRLGRRLVEAIETSGYAPDRYTKKEYDEIIAQVHQELAARKAQQGSSGRPGLGASKGRKAPRYLVSFKPSTAARLAIRARREGRSVSSVIRDLVEASIE
jgi:hypothetical protein